MPKSIDFRTCIRCGSKLFSVEQGCFCTPCLKKMGKEHPPALPPSRTPIHDRLKNSVGYRGQKYAVYFTRDGEEHLMGWQNEPSGGLEGAAKMMPGVTATRVAEAARAEGN